ncbi:Alpha/beta hydrolase family protein [Acanthamoeba polyphaga moumouvirus]|uniref:Alpha/beta hydrolase family protein n=1 Tax=Acanthamoeba polyphaga moumouvirus TaxID=1269028 RepID=L7RDK4_9VIRU|nr:Alpha/beta hydrolase family protein [Acanthamoeba polyphaga moumouvirus]AGC02153.1 Alpha/beta hydrolase family protein [Acanthamoeba polyphaga moumouvirus]
MYKKLIPMIIVIIIVIIAIVYFKQDNLYKPFKPVESKYRKFIKNIFSLVESYDDIVCTYVKTSDNELLDVYYIKNPDSDKCIIYFHGNKGNVSMRYEIIKFLYNYSSVIVFDYRSFGKSSGNKENLSSHTLNLDAKSIWLYTINVLKYKPSSICIYGESLGSSVALRLVSEITQKFDIEFHPHSLILVSPFYSLSKMIEHESNNLGLGYFGKLIGFFMGKEYESQKLIQLISHKTRIIIAHSINDDIVPYNQGKKLYDMIKNTHPNIKFVDLLGTHNKLKLTDNYVYTLAEIFNN